MLREMVNHDSLPFPALGMNGSLSTSDLASDEIFVPRGIVGNHILFSRCFGDPGGEGGKVRRHP